MSPSTLDVPLSSLNDDSSSTKDDSDSVEPTSVKSNNDDKNDGNNNNKKRNRRDMTEAEIKEERKAANRRSAYQSRLRKKLLIEELQLKVGKLSDELKRLRAENRVLSSTLEGALAENRKLRFMQQEVLYQGSFPRMHERSSFPLTMMAQLQAQHQLNQQASLVEALAKQQQQQQAGQEDMAKKSSDDGKKGIGK